MKYLLERGLYYYFLMREVSDTNREDLWAFITKTFSLEPKIEKTYNDILSNQILDELNSVYDMEMYLSYLDFCSNEDEFGKKSVEKDIIHCKLLALHKIKDLFGDNHINNRLYLLAHYYERDHGASVLYALHMLYLNKTSDCCIFAIELLEKELKEGKDCDAGLILLSLKKDDVNETVAHLKSLPDILLRPEIQEYLNRQYGEVSGGVILNKKRTIGF